MFKLGRISKRAFLNPVSSSNTGSYSWYIERSKYTKKNDIAKKKHYHFSGGFKIYDCRKGIQLDLYGDHDTGSGRSSYKQSVKKMRALASAALECANEMEAFWEGIEEDIKNHNENIISKKKKR